MGCFKNACFVNTGTIFNNILNLFSSCVENAFKTLKRRLRNAEPMTKIYLPFLNIQSSSNQIWSIMQSSDIITIFWLTIHQYIWVTVFSLDVAINFLQFLGTLILSQHFQWLRPCTLIAKLNTYLSFEIVQSNQSKPLLVYFTSDNRNYLITDNTNTHTLIQTYHTMKTFIKCDVTLGKESKKILAYKKKKQLGLLEMIMTFRHDQWRS